MVTKAPKLSVTISKVDTVLPEEKIEDHVYFLTNLDQNVALNVKTVHLFHAQERKVENPADVIKESLIKLLKYYYPMAGRMGISTDGKLQVNYNSQGVVFVEASVDAKLEDLGDISRPGEHLQQLVYTVPEATNILDTPIVTVQVTKFKCGGFVFGLANEHAVTDGIATLEFLRTWGELARGIPISTTPVIDRSVLKARSPPQIDFPHHEFAEIDDVSDLAELNIPDIVHESFCFTPKDANALKKKVMLSGDIKKCSTFQIISGLIWRARTTAMKMAPQQQTRLYFAVDGRKKLSPPLPEGYMGNGIVLTYAMSTAADLCDKPLHHAVKLVQEAIELIDDRYMRSAIDYFEVTHARPAIAGSVIFTTWSHLAFQSMDFGWGGPSQSGPVILPDRHLAIFLAHGKDRKSVNVVLGLPPKVMDVFKDAVQESRA